eukprot:m.16812 g.16812  ORF g.16812 m.16812 type:complete len:209 (-) comp3536_c0_seq1:217-843(-)
MADIEQELATCEADLERVRQEIAAANEQARRLRVVESQIQDHIASLRVQQSARMQQTVASKAEQLRQEINRRDQVLRDMQQQVARALQDKATMERELEQISKLGSSVSSHQMASTTRYDVHALTSHDPLNQRHVEDGPRKAVPTHSTAIDDIGMRDTASPYVHKDEYQDIGMRASDPAFVAQGRFSDWRRPGSRVRQPPGGHSSNIFG